MISSRFPWAIALIDRVNRDLCESARAFAARGRRRLRDTAALARACGPRRFVLAAVALAVAASAGRAISPISLRGWPAAAEAGAAQTTPQRNRSLDYQWLPPRRIDQFHSLCDRIPAPAGYARVQAPADSFAEWLRHLPVLPENSPVTTPSGGIVLEGDHPNLAAVVDLQPRRPSGAAGAKMLLRLRAEFGWWRQDDAVMSFHYASGHRSDWRDWAAGLRPVASGESLRIAPAAQSDSSRTAFEEYLAALLRYASNDSVLDDTRPIRNATIAAGDVFIDSGKDGVSLIILDVATSPRGRVRVLLGETATPAQTFHVLRNDRGSPWFPITRDAKIDLGPRGAFEIQDLRRWAH